MATTTRDSRRKIECRTLQKQLEQWLEGYQGCPDFDLRHQAMSTLKKLDATEIWALHLMLEGLVEWREQVARDAAVASVRSAVLRAIDGEPPAEPPARS
jgi:hypothetical protein